MIRLIAFCLCFAAPAFALETEYGNQVTLRGLDKISGDVGDIEISTGSAGSYGRLTIAVSECRFPRANPAADSYAFVTISHEGIDQPLFSGWIIASSPALNAFDHHRYDIWLLRCTTS